MAGRGVAYLPLHYGHPPEKLYRRMRELSGIVADLIAEKYGSDEFIRRISDPFWFHSLSIATGFDWNSSGTTTTTLSALKEYFRGSTDSGIFVAGGKGEVMASVSEDFEKQVKRGHLRETDSIEIRRRAKELARVDNNLLQDGYDLYLHFIVVNDRGNWAVVQQGMNGKERMARRYHWHRDSFGDRLRDGRSGISAETAHESVRDISALKSEENRKGMVDMMRDDPWRYRDHITQGGQTTLDNHELDARKLRLDVRVDWNRLRQIYEMQPRNFIELMDVKGAGKSAMRAISYLSQVVYGSDPSWIDPVKFSFGLGGKDGIPKPVNYRDYDVCIEFYRELLGNLREGDSRLSAIAENLNRRYGKITGNFL
ncbi:MAG: DUF763 domain-containing protein [Candidatus Thermoplasmatota archaeon]|nr:DUF763 domain-containing protein [Candidatus Thermoplasmatota archaeon]MCL5437807.1 DUF763 domain-containing protein [Candidatus Thermoplasmatota archaeon]